MSDSVLASEKKSPNLKKLLLPFVLTISIIVLDQITKALIVSNIKLHTVGFKAFGDFLRIIHTRNPGIAFSLGRGMGDTIRTVLFIVLPFLVLGVVVYFYFKTEMLSRLQRWAVAGVLGGGLGNLIDRVFRSGGVVDFVDIKFYGLFGMQRWPTFNVADASVVVCGIILLAAFLFTRPDREDGREGGAE